MRSDDPDITVILPDIDGAELKREKKGRHILSDDRYLSNHIQEALDSLGKKQYGIPGKAWERIFGGRRNS